MRWNSFPFFRITLALICGILANNFFRLSDKNLLPWLVVSISVFLIILFFLTIKVNITKSLRSILLLVSFVLLGYFSSQLVYTKNLPDIDDQILNKVNFYSVTINSKPNIGPNSYRYQIIIDELKTSDSIIHIHQKGILYLLDSTAFNYGDELIIRGKPFLLKNQLNPHVFDYSLYLQRKGIFLQGFCSKNDYILKKENKRNSIKYLHHHIGDHFENILDNHIYSKRELNMVKAMILGRRNEVSSEMEYVYESTGTSHILAVSGLHVGIIFLLVSYIFAFLNNEKFKWVYFGIVIFVIC